MRRFFIHSNAVDGNLVHLTGTEARHMAKVLRLQPGTKVELFDGSGQIFLAQLQSVSPETVEALIEKITDATTDSDVFPVNLIQGILKGKKMDWLVQKATELGVHHLTAFTSRYCENKNNLDRQMDRWNRIMLEACKQCKRTVPMRISKAGKLKEINQIQEYTLHPHRFVAWEKETLGFPNDFAQTQGPISLCIGPEGGWHEDEISYFQSEGFRTVSLGNNILRGETAAITAVSIVRYLCGDLGNMP